MEWRRLVEDGKTCPRCGSTEVELDLAIDWLRDALSPLGIEVVLEKKEIPIAEFKRDPLKSNLILINGKPLEEYISAETGQSQCCDVCGTAECRTIEANGKSFDTIPSELIKKAGVIAALTSFSCEDPGVLPCC
ncbi:MAG: DUF2703 domain-containing protein [bacterium]